MRRRLRDPSDPGGVETVAHRAVLRRSDPLSGLVEALEVGVCGAPVSGAQLGARHAEAGAQLDERQHAPLVGADTVDRAVGDLADASEVRAGMLPAVGGWVTVPRLAPLEDHCLLVHGSELEDVKRFLAKSGDGRHQVNRVGGLPSHWRVIRG
jgi:hypothetical protein